MDKAQLLAFITSLPDDLLCLPVEITEAATHVHGWESLGRSTIYGGVHEQKVDNDITLNLQFTTKFQGEFRRTYENSDGVFSNVRRVK